MRIDRGRTGKLILAFHFQLSDQAGWKCETCRAAGLEKERRCGFLPKPEHGVERAVWSRNRLVAISCPKSLISGQSLAWIEEYYAWKLAGGADYRTLSARQLDAFCALEQAVTQERSSARE